VVYRQKTFPENGLVEDRYEADTPDQAILKCILENPDSLILVEGVYRLIPEEVGPEWNKFS
jgi:hypothetical protein